MYPICQQINESHTAGDATETATKRISLIMIGMCNIKAYNCTKYANGHLSLLAVGGTALSINIVIK